MDRDAGRMHCIIGAIIHLLDLSPLLAFRMLFPRGFTAEVGRIEAGGGALGAVATPT